MFSFPFKGQTGALGRRLRATLPVLLGGLALLFLGCDGGGSAGGDDPGGATLDEGGYTATISGAVTLDETGLAQFTDPADSDAPGWQFTIELTKAAPIAWKNGDYYFDVFVSNRQLEALPSTGSYDIVSYFEEDLASEFSGEFSLSPADGGDGYVRFEATSGTVTIASVGTDRIQGEVEFTGVRGDTGDTVTVEATFNAERAQPTL
jgi:hypothetical protein